MKKPAFLKQKNMLRVLYALIPVALTAVYYFGWRVIALLVVSIGTAFVTEWVMAERRNGKLSYALFVTASLYALSLPPTLPFWMAAVGAFVAILFGKEAFGGFGKNVFNPAIVGRAFVYVCFPIPMTARFVPAFNGIPGGFGRWSFASMQRAPSYINNAGLEISDALTAATPMWANRDFGHVTGLVNLIVGNIGGVFTSAGNTKVLAAGSAGEVCAIAILIGAAYLIYTKTAQWRLILSSVLGATFLSLFMRYILGMEVVPSLLFTLFSGGLLYASVFMVTDPVSAPKLPVSQWIYGAFFGAMVVFFRAKSIFAGGVGFALLLGNMLAPSLDFWIKRYLAHKEAAK